MLRCSAHCRNVYQKQTWKAISDGLLPRNFRRSRHGRRYVYVPRITALCVPLLCAPSRVFIPACIGAWWCVRHREARSDLVVEDRAAAGVSAIISPRSAEERPGQLYLELPLDHRPGASAVATRPVVVSDPSMSETASRM